MSEINSSEILSAYLDGETSAEEFKRVNEMLASSIEWRQELERLNATKVALATAQRHAAPEDLVAALLAHPALAKRREPKSFLSRLMPESRPWALAGAAGFAATVFAVWAVVTSPWAPQTLPLEPLMAAHARTAAGDATIHATLMSASMYSAELASEYAASR